MNVKNEYSKTNGRLVEFVFIYTFKKGFLYIYFQKFMKYDINDSDMLLLILFNL